MSDQESPSFIKVFKGAATDEYCKNMIDSWEYIHNNSSSIAVEMKGEESNGNSTNRKDSSYFFELENDLEVKKLTSATYAILNKCLKEYMEEHPSLGNHNLMCTAVKVQKTKPKGGFHIWHCEQKGMKDALRQLTWTIYLNDIPNGEGETEFLEYGVRVQPKKGDVCIFPASWTHTHRGNPVYTKDKYIATGWWYGTEGEIY